MNDYVVNGHTPRQLAEAIVRAVLEADTITTRLGSGDPLRQTLLGDAVLDTLTQYGVRFTGRPVTTVPTGDKK